MTTTGVPELVPARMLNEFAYCPRLCYLEWVQGEFAHSADTSDGRFQHRRVDQPTGNLALPPPSSPSPSPSDDDADADAGDKIHARSVTLSDDALGAIARVDLVEADGKCATPVDYKRGAVPDVPGNAHEPERVQLCVQGLLLRANGYDCRQGVLYFVASRRRVTIEFDDVLVRRTKSLLDETRAMAGAGRIPAPLEDSPKCPRCSLVGICLPDEVTFLKGSRYVARPDDVRRMAPARDDALPLYVQTQGAMVGKSGDELTVKSKGEVIAKARLLGRLCWTNCRTTRPLPRGEVNCDAQPAYRGLRCQRPGAAAAGAPQDERVRRRLAVFRFRLRPVGQGAGSAGGGADGAHQSEGGPGADI